MLNGTDHQEAFRFTLYGSDKKEKGYVTLNYHTEVSDAFIKQVEAMTYEEGDYITITSPIYNSIEVIGKNNQTTSFENDDRLLHTRIELQNDGVNVIYNKAPKLKGVDDARVVYGNTFDPMDGVTVEDEDTDLTVNVSGNEVNNQREFTATKIGTYQLTYSVTDSYGRTTTATRMVEIVPVYTTNEIQYYDDQQQLRFAIGINQSATGFTYRLPEPLIPDEQVPLSYDESQDNLDVPNKTLFKLKIYDTTGEIVNVLEITEQTIINESLFETLIQTQVRPRYRFSIEADDLSKLKVTGRLEKDSHINSIDYDSLTNSNLDAIQNVRFELTENIVKAIYNEAPVIAIAPTSDSNDSENITLSNSSTIDNSTLIYRNKALTKEAYNLLEGVTVDDDKDNLTLTVDNVTVPDQMLVSDLDASVATIDQTYTVTYKVTDSWGRESQPVTREVTIQSAMDDVNITFLHAGAGLQPSMTNKAAILSFNMKEERITVTQKNMNFKYREDVQYGAFSITKPNDEENDPTFKYILGGTNTYDQNTEFSDAPKNNRVSAFKTALEAKQYQYGDKIKIKIAQSPFVYIEGTVINAQEDYIKGAKLGSVLENSYFEITPEGLKQEYTPPATINPDFSEMTWYSGVAGNKSFSVALNTDNPDELKLISQAYETEPIDTLEYGMILRIYLYGLNGQKRLETNSKGRVLPSDIAGAWNDRTVSVGEYFKITIEKNTRLANFKLFNLPNMYYFPTTINYGDIISERTYFDDVRFYVTTDGLVPVYNKGPVFNGAEDTDVIVGTEFDVRGGVTVTDEIDDQIEGQTLDYTVSSTTIDTSTVGVHTLTYTATDSWGRETTHQRTINVRPKLFNNKIQVFGANRTENPAFEIIFDNQKQTQGTDATTKSTTNSQALGGFTINRYSSQLLDSSQPTQDVFKLWVLNADGIEKAKVVLQGRDTADSDKLNVLDTIDYRDGDIIKVWRRPNSSQTTDSMETLKITGNVLDKNNNSVNFSDGLSTVEKMNNTIFKVSDNGLQSFYNEAPKFKGLQDKVLYYGEPFNKLEGISVTDDYQSLTLSEDNVKTNFVQGTVGDYTATYTITDAFGRTTSQTINIKVKSKLEKNKIKIHGSTTTGDELKFSIGFNDLGNKFVLEGTDSAIEKFPFSGTFQFTVYGRNGNIKHQMTINQDDTEETVRQKLNELKDLTLTTGDSIALNHSESGYVKIEGTVQDASVNYDNGFTENTMSTVRFQLIPDGLKEIKATDFTITVDGSLTIKRGEEYNLLEGLSVQHPTETISITNTSVTIAGFDISKIGEQTVTYTVTDSWGKSASVTRQVTVEALNAVDTNKIHVKSEVLNSKRLTIGFDALEMKLTAKPQDNIISKIFKDLPKDSVVFSLSIYDNNQELQSTYTFNANDVNSYSQVMEQINNQTFNYGDYIALTAYNYDKLDFDGTVTLDERNQQNTSRLSDSAITVDKSEFIMNARFQITEDGLVALYNEAPTLTKKDSIDDIELSIGEEEKILEFIEVHDDLDELTTSDVEIKTEADFYHPGQYEVTYTVTDTWGRTASLTATLYVLSELQKNEIIVKSADNQEKLFTVGFNSKTEQLTWTFNEQNSEPLDSSKGNQEVMSLTIYNEKGEKLQRLSLNGNDTKDTIKQNLSSFIDNYKYHYGYYINIDIADERTQNITINNVEIQSEQIPEDSYQEGVVTNKDYFENVRFELEAQLGLVAIYNEAPILTLEDEHKEFIKSLDINDYDLLSGISLSDDQDVLDVEQHVKIYCNPEESVENDPTTPLDDANNENNIYYADRLHLGDNKIYYVVTDSWGRESEPQIRTLTLTHAMKNTSIVFDTVSLKQNVDSSSDIPALTINYDPDTNRLYATKGTASTFKLNYHAYTLDVYDQEGNRVYGAIYGTHDNKISFFDESEYLRQSKFPATLTNYSQNAVDHFTNVFKNRTVEEGWSIRVRSVQAPFVKINGTVINAQEDYSLGASICEILNESRFYITEEGLKQEYTPPTVEENLSKITWYSGVAGLKQFDLVYDSVNRTLTVETVEGETEPLDTLYYTNVSVGYDLFTITIYSRDTNVKFQKTFKTRQKASDVKNAINDAHLTIEYGDYLEIDLIERRRTNMRIYGALTQNKETVNLDYYQTGVPDLSYYNDARFYFTETGLSLDYNEAPVFSGVDDTVLFAGEAPLNLRDGVTVTDDNTPNINYKITATAFNPETDNYETITELSDDYTTDTVGAQEIYYVAKDSLGRITVAPRFIWVYARSQITVRDESKLTVQEADPTLRTEDDVYRYLIDMVQVKDVEDDAAGKPIQVTKNNIKTNFDPMTPGEYDVTYTVTDSDQNISTETFKITVVRSINVSVPRNDIPFQVVTNLLDEDTEEKEFISGTIKIQNNYVTDVEVSVKSLTVSDTQSNTRNGTFDLVEPNSVNWGDLSKEDTMTKMALGLYAKSGFTGDNIPTKDNPIWLTTDMSKTAIGVLPKRENDLSSQSTEAVLSFTAKYGKNFDSGKHRMKFTMVLEFE